MFGFKMESSAFDQFLLCAECLAILCKFIPFFFENVLNKHLMERESSFRCSFHDKTN